MNAASVDLSPEDLETLLKLLDHYVPEAEVWAFGSRVQGNARPFSDLDLALIPEESDRLAREEPWLAGLHAASVTGRTATGPNAGRRTEGNVSGLERGYPVSEQIELATKVLIDSAFAMDILLRELLDEVAERRGIDRRWLNARSTFANLQAKGLGVSTWPCRYDELPEQPRKARRSGL